MKDTIYRSDAIEAVHGACNYCETCDLKDIGCSQINALSALPSAENSNAKTQNSNQETQNSNGDLIYRADAIDAIQNAYCKPCKERGDDHNEVRCRVCEYDNAIIQIDALPSADAEPKWNCTANFVAEQLEKLKDMTDEERIKLLHILFPSADAEPSLKAIKRQIDEHWYLDPPSAEAVQRGW